MKNANISTITRGVVLGLPVAASSPRRVAQLIQEEALITRNPCLISFADVEVLARAAHYSVYETTMKVFDLICPDSAPVVWMLHDGKTVAERTARRLFASEIMKDIFQSSRNAPQWKHFLLGGTAETLEKLQNNIQEQYPGVNIAGSYALSSTDLGDAESRRIADMIESCEANLVWVSMSCPRQERWLAHHAHILTPAVYLAVGSAFKILSGEETPAPPWMQKMGLEWVRKVVKSPKGLFRRYLVWNILFFYYALFRRGK